MADSRFWSEVCLKGMTKNTEHRLRLAGNGPIDVIFNGFPETGFDAVISKRPQWHSLKLSYNSDACAAIKHYQGLEFNAIVNLVIHLSHDAADFFSRAWSFKNL